MDNTPLISVIIPVYNGERYIEKSVESILNQTYKKIEIIIVNDGSTDRTNVILNNLSNKYSIIKLINRNVNKGLPYSLNEGLNVSRGYFIARMDADDISDPTRFEKQLQYFKTHPGVALLGSSYNVIDQNSIFIKKAQHPIDSLTLFLAMSTDNQFCHPSVMFKRYVIFNVGEYRNTEAEDYDLFSRIILKYPCANIADPLISYRHYSSNRSNSYSEKIFNSRLQVSLNYFNNLNIRINVDMIRNLFLFIEGKDKLALMEILMWSRIYYKIFQIACKQYNLSTLKMSFHFIKFIKNILLRPHLIRF